MKQVCVLGPDGAGKTTIINYLKHKIEQDINMSAAAISTTQVIPGLLSSQKWRDTLVSSDASNFERFNAAYCLYTANISHYVRKEAPDMCNLLDVLLLDRGGSSMITYNPLPNREKQLQQIPKVDCAIYVYASFELLTERLRSRNSSDFQDIDLEYRRKVYENGFKDFQEWTNRTNTPGFLLCTDAGSAEDNTSKAVGFLAPELQKT